LTSKQLAALAWADEAFEAAGLDYWLFGGWAVDFYAGTVTRAHDDIDIAVWLEDLPQIAELLEENGWRHAPHKDEDGGTGYERDEVRLELTFLVRDGEDIYIPLRSGRGVWPDGAFGSDRRELSGVPARLIALDALMRGKASARDDPDDAAKDRTDFEVLSRL
jgi:hypothetical protein